MVLIDRNGNEILPYACVSPIHAPNGGILVCAINGPGRAGRIRYDVDELKKTNDPKLVEAYVKNLEQDFFDWCDAQHVRRASGKPFRLEQGDIVPIGVALDCSYPDSILTEVDQRTEDDFLAPFDNAVKIYKAGRS